MKYQSVTRSGLLACTALASVAMLPGQALAQDAEENIGLEEIIVTAQKREQSVQDVPIAVTAVTQETLKANRIFTVNDLGSIAPGLTVRPSAGGVSSARPRNEAICDAQGFASRSLARRVGCG